MRIIADVDVCVAAGMCAMAAPTVFDQDPVDGEVVLLTEHPEPDDAEAVREAVRLCPSGALSIAEGLAGPPADLAG